MKPQLGIRSTARTRILWLVLLGAPLIPALVVFSGFSLASPRVVVRAVTADGIEMCVVQQAEPNVYDLFTTSFVYRKPGGRWGWFYFDHEDIWWWRGRAELDSKAKSLTVFRGSESVLTFDWTSQTYRLWQGGVLRRVVSGPQKWLPANWSPEQPMVKG